MFSVAPFLAAGDSVLATRERSRAIQCYNRFMRDDLRGLPALNAASESLIHITIPVGMLQCNCSIIGDPLTREALVVDPGDEVTRILDLLGRRRLTVKAIVSTHAHIDHVGGLAKLHQYTGAPVLMHRDDLQLYQAMDVQASFLGVLPPDVTEVDQLLKEGDVLRWGSLEAQVIHTPGHTPGSVSLYLPHDCGKIILTDKKSEADAKSGGNHGGEAGSADNSENDEADSEKAEPGKTEIRVPQLLSGDTLFAGSIGRTDLWGGSMDEIMDSLRSKLMQLPDATIVHPGHGAMTTIGRERETNPFLQAEWG